MATTEPLYPIYPIRLVSGDTWRRDLQVVDPDPDSPDPENPVMIPRDLTGWTAIAQIRASTKKDAALIAQIALTGFGSDGFIHMYISPEESTKLTRRYGWDLELISPSGDVETIIGGPVEPQGDYSR